MTRRRVGHPHQLLPAIEAYRRTHPYGPSVRELQEALGASSTSVITNWLLRCYVDGLVVHERGIARSLRLTAAGRALIERRIAEAAA